MGAPPALGARVPVEQRRGVDGRPHRDACRPEREDSLACRLEHGGRGGNEEQARCQSLYERYRDCKTRLTEAIIADRKSRKASLFDG
mmetsp:Transcript_8025/g.24691  ORF Transcript_8025/g.24691 Transcript_8025/m.24691 type:complete len:87 (+) Transcript_8025:373-633(+)